MDLCGTRIGGYVIRSLLSDSGGMGTVWAASHHLEPRRRAVVKVIRAELLPRVDLVERFLREAIAGMQVKHPRLVEIYDVAQLADGRPYILMEFLDGGDLEAYVASFQRFTADDTLRIVAQVAEGLEVLHGAGIVHRDLKPSNVFLVEGESRVVKIVDFGLAKAPSNSGERLTHHGFVAGSPYYVAPEQVTDFRSADSRADVYALAMITVRMVAGRLPYAADSDREASNPLVAALMRQRDNPYLARQVLEVEAAPDVPPAWFEHLERGIAISPDARWPRARDLVFALADALPEGPAIVKAVARSLYENAAPTDATRKNPTGTPATAVHSIGAPPPAPSTGTGPTTHTAAAGAVERQDHPASRRARTAVTLVVGGVVAAGLAVVAVSALDRGTNSSNGNRTPAPVLVDEQPTAPPAPTALVRVRIAAEPAGAVLAVDGEPLGQSPAVVALPAGSVVEVRADLAGYVSKTERLTVAEGTSVSITLIPEPIVDAGTVPTAATRAPPRTKPRPAPRRERDQPTPSERTKVEQAPTSTSSSESQSKAPDLGHAAGPR